MNINKIIKERYIVQFMGMGSEKFGGLERFMIGLSKILKPDLIFLILVYNSPPKSEIYRKKLEENGIPIFISNAKDPINLLKTILRIRLRYTPLLFHSHFQPIFSCLFGMLLQYKERWVSLRTMIHDSVCSENVEAKALSRKTKISRFIINHTATRFFAVSRAIRFQYSHLYPYQSNKIETFYMGSEKNDFDRIKIREKLNFTKEIVYICCVAFALPIKGIDVLIDALKLLKNYISINKVILCLIGLDEKLDYTNNLNNQIMKNDLDKNVIQFGVRDNVPELLKAMDIYCQPSRSEAISMTLIEAAMASLPLVGSNVGGISEIVIENRTGYLFESGNSTQLALQLKSLILNEKLRIQLGENALNYALENFDREHQIEKMREIYIEYFTHADKKA